MSRVGKHPVEIPAGVNVVLEGGVLKGKGKNGEFGFRLHESVSAEIVDNKIIFKPCGEDKVSRSMWGTSRAIVAKAVRGLSEKFTKKINFVGVGYKASVQGKKLIMQLGYSHDVVFEIPDDLQMTCESPTVVTISGADSQRVGEIVKRLQRFRPLEPYKGKGIVIEGQYVYRKEGKKK
ncbi:MAG: 50S ribosomal protein L6 [Holosporaceae bacterium]|jgi:large subunit ribosomal protein L6|nr:50S ribosomal protein L6 [Holosporaceae bacterium]